MAFLKQKTQPTEGASLRNAFSKTQFLAQLNCSVASNAQAGPNSSRCHSAPIPCENCEEAFEALEIPSSKSCPDLREEKLALQLQGEIIEDPKAGIRETPLEPSGSTCSSSIVVVQEGGTIAGSCPPGEQVRGVTPTRSPISLTQTSTPALRPSVNPQEGRLQFESRLLTLGKPRELETVLESEHSEPISPTFNRLPFGRPRSVASGPAGPLNFYMGRPEREYPRTVEANLHENSRRAEDSVASPAREFSRTLEIPEIPHDRRVSFQVAPLGLGASDFATTSVA